MSLKNNWQTKKLGEICEIVNGGTPKTNIKKYWDGDILWSTPKDMGRLESIFISSTERKISKDGLKNSSAKVIPINSIILSSRAPIGYLAINKKEITTNQGCKGIIPKKEIDFQFLFYFLKYSVDLLQKLGSGTTFKELSSTKLKDIEIPLPSFSEQKRIVKILDEVFEGIGKAKENAEKKEKNSRELFESYLQSIFDKKNNDWETKKLGDVYDVRDGTHDSPKYQKEGFALITSKNLKRDELDYRRISYISKKDYDKINDRSKVHKGDILFAMIGTIGNPVVIKIDPDFAIKNVALFKIPKEQNSYFLKYFLDSKFVMDKMTSEAKGTTQKFVGLGYLRDFKIQLPKLSEQKSIVKKLDTLAAHTKKLEEIYKQKIIDLDELKKSVLKKTFNGEL